MNRIRQQIRRAKARRQVERGAMPDVITAATLAGRLALRVCG